MAAACAVAVVCQPLAKDYLIVLDPFGTFESAEYKAGAGAPASFECQCCRVMMV